MAIGIQHKRPSAAGRIHLDWTRRHADQELTDFQHFTRENVDWSNSPLGPIGEWPASLRQMVLVIMADPTPSAVLYGPFNRAAIVYNEAFAALIGQRHPALQGRRIADQLEDLCRGFDAAWERQIERGALQIICNQRLRHHRRGFVEEKSYQWKLVPMVGDEGYVDGSVVTVTRDVHDGNVEKRVSMLRELGSAFHNALDFTAKQTALSFMRFQGHFSHKRSLEFPDLWQEKTHLVRYGGRYEKFADLAPVGIAMLDHNHLIEYANKAYHEIMGDAAGCKSLLDSIHPDDRARVESYFDLIPYRDTPLTFECRLGKLSNQPALSPSEAPLGPVPTCVLASIYMQHDPDPCMVFWIIDITTHKSAEEFLRRRMDEAIEMRRQKEHFIDMISHEVRNPLSALLHCTDEIIEETKKSHIKGAADILEAAHTVQYCSQHIRNIVGDVLTLSKMDSRLVEICPGPVRPLEVIENALKIFQSQTRAGKMELVFEHHPSLREHQVDMLSIDPTRVLQVLINLVTNAIKVTKGRSVRKIVVRVGAGLHQMVPVPGLKYVPARHSPKLLDFGNTYNDAQRLYLLATVEDTGPGMMPEELDNLFERFSQDDPKTESKYGGAGLGLFITRTLTELQGGRLGVATTPGKGTKFIFSIEARRVCGRSAHLIPLKLEVPDLLHRTRTVETPVISSPTKIDLASPVSCSEHTGPRKVLVVEDNLINQRVLAGQLRKRGYDVSVALHGQEALEILRMTTTSPDPAHPDFRTANTIFDVVLMDIEMPVMDGLSCAQEIRAFERAAACPGRLPIVAVTANARKEQSDAARDAGMDAVTTKPYRIAELVKQIEDVCDATPMLTMTDVDRSL